MDDLEEVPDLDLGDDHFLKFTTWAPDDLPANRERYGTPLPNVDKWGAIVWHFKPDGTKCEGVITFDGELQKKYGSGPMWKVECWEPLTLSPSLQCGSCSDHGFVRNGKWVRA